MFSVLASQNSLIYIHYWQVQLFPQKTMHQELQIMPYM